ncbi:MAG: GNAT family N-acetyltransferase [Candidatus Latescibacteria bacterium]|nr:GNAT family N-acetyltransferase [Candidatus Latescibacterota bacterium]
MPELWQHLVDQFACDTDPVHGIAGHGSIEASDVFRKLIDASGPRWIEVQTNDALLSNMLHEFAVDHASHTILFADGATTTLAAPAGAVVRRVTEADRFRMFGHTAEPVGEWGIESEGEIVATGGLLFHYNPPYGDIFMEVAPAHRRKGIGRYLVQELKRIAYEVGHTPAARCREDNVASRRTLERAGMFPCGRIVRGRVAR